MAKIVRTVRDIPGGDPEAAIDIDVIRQSDSSVLATVTTDANGRATWSQDGSPGPVLLEATVGSQTKRYDGRSQVQMGTVYPADIPVANRAIGSGVIRDYIDPVLGGIPNDMAVSAGTGLAVNVSTGAAIVDGHVYRCSAPTSLPVTANATGSTRYDRVILRLTREGQTEEGKIELLVKAGTSSASGPSLTKSTATYEFSLALLAVANGASSFVAGNLTSERTNATLGQSYIQSLPAAAGSTGTILYTNSGVWSKLVAGTDGQVLTQAAGKPSWAAAPSTTIADGSIAPAKLQTVDVAHGGTGATTLTGIVKAAGTAAMTAVTAPSGAIVGTTDTQTLTNKTLTAPAISSPTGLAKADVGLGNVDNTSDANKPLSTAETTALAGKSAITHTHTVTAPFAEWTKVDHTATAISTTSTTVASVSLGPLVSGVVYDVEAHFSGAMGVASTGFITSQVRIETSGTIKDGMDTGTVGGERTLEAHDFKTITGAGSSITVTGRAQMSTSTGTVNSALLWAKAVPRLVPAS